MCSYMMSITFYVESSDTIANIPICSKMYSFGMSMSLFTLCLVTMETTFVKNFPQKCNVQREKGLSAGSAKQNDISFLHFLKTCTCFYFFRSIFF